MLILHPLPISHFNVLSRAFHFAVRLWLQTASYILNLGQFMNVERFRVEFSDEWKKKLVA